MLDLQLTNMLWRIQANDVYWIVILLQLTSQQQLVPNLPRHGTKKSIQAGHVQEIKVDFLHFALACYKRSTRHDVIIQQCFICCTTATVLCLTTEIFYTLAHHLWWEANYLESPAEHIQAEHPSVGVDWAIT